MKLRTEPRIAQPDELYARLMALHRDADAEESLKLNARLILILANHIGDESVLNEALDLAGRNTKNPA